DAVLSRAVERGSLPETIDRTLLVEVSSALLFSRLFITGGSLDTGFVRHLVDAVLMPLLDHQANRGQQPSLWQAVMLSLLSGVLGGNDVPHLTPGLPRERYPRPQGTRPTPNFMPGWVGLALPAIPLHWALMDRHPGPAFAAATAGVLLIGLFHAGPGAFGRREEAEPSPSIAD